MTLKSLEASIPANNEKIIEIYKKVKSKQLNPSPDFQRKLVWKKQHKYNFIKTILLNYPFPEIYKAPGELNVDTLELADLIVDGQQRVTTIVDFIDGNDVFSSPKAPVKFSNLTEDEKKKLLNYEVSIRYLKGVGKAQIKEIFQRINNTEYSLNPMERLNAQWGDSEFVCYAKQLIEEDLNIDPELLGYKIDDDIRNDFLSFFHNNKVFTENDNNRMLSLQYILTLVSTVIKGEYFRRNNETQKYIELYNDDFDIADEVTVQLHSVTELLRSLELDDNSYWFNKANVFSLIVELYQYDLETVDKEVLKEELVRIEGIYKKYVEDPNVELEKDLQRYFEFAKEGVNEKTARDHRGKVIDSIVSAIE